MKAVLGYTEKLPNTCACRSLCEAQSDQIHTWYWTIN